MALIYFVIGHPGGVFHIVYQVPGTCTFSSVATSSSEVLADELAADLNCGNISIPQKDGA